MDEVLLFGDTTGELDGPLCSGLSVEGRERCGLETHDARGKEELFEGPEIAGIGTETLEYTSFLLQESQVLFRRVSSSLESFLTVNDKVVSSIQEI